VTSEMSEQLAFLRWIAECLEQAGIPYMLTGSLALALYAQPRMTRDIDIVIEYGPPDSAILVGLFEDLCVVDQDSIEEAARFEGMFNIIHKEWIIKADFIARKRGAFDDSEFSRRRTMDIGGMSIWVISPEDLILAKLDWGKDSRSELQMRDVRSLIASSEELDWGYLREWAARLGVGDLLEECGPP
jgi:hypothetical protein